MSLFYHLSFQQKSLNEFQGFLSFIVIKVTQIKVKSDGTAMDFMTVFSDYPPNK